MESLIHPIFRNGTDKLKPINMTREKLVQQIDGLYPTDCQYEDTNTIGKLLLQKAIENVKYNWRDLPMEVLQEYHRLCADEENNGELTHELREKGLLTGA